MKLPLYLSFSIAGTVLLSQEPMPEAGPHHRVVREVRQVQRPDGTFAVRTNSYVQLETGLNRLEGDRWVPADGGLEIVGTSIVSRRAAHSAIWDASVLAGFDVQLPDGARMQGRCLGLAFYDAASGKSVLIAELKESVAELQPGNIVLYRDAFDGNVTADLVFLNEKDRVEQIVLIHAMGDTPKDYGLDETSCRLEVMSEFTQAPVPRKSPRFLRQELDLRKRALMVEPDIVDEGLDFGAMHMPEGLAFALAGDAWRMDASSAIPVAKRWQVTDDRRIVLFEAVEYGQFKPLLVAVKENAVSKPLVQRRQPSLTRELPARRVAQKGTVPVRVASSRMNPEGLAIDFSLLNAGTISNATLYSGLTYYVSGSVTLAGASATIEPCVVKFSPTNSARLNLACNNVTWLASAYRPVVLTGRDDNSQGESITNATLSGYYANIALNVQSPLTAVSLSHLKILHAQTAIAFGQGTGHDVSHAQFVNCGVGLKLSSAETKLRNALMVNVSTDFDLTSSTARVEHLTSDTASLLNTGGTLYLTNSLLVAVAATNSWSGAAVTSVASSVGVFASAAAGSHYLAAGSPYRNAGVTNISADLQREFKGMTTVAPVILTQPITLSSTLLPQAGRDVDQPDQGWHYDALDYLATWLTVSTNTTLTLKGGVSLGFYGDTGLWLQDGAVLVSEGTPGRLNHLVPLLQVQEQPLTTYQAGALTVINPSCNTNNAPSATLRFTSFDNLTGYSVFQGPPNFRLASFDLRHSSLASGTFYVELTAPSVNVTLLNNVFERHSVQFLGTVSLSAYNNLFKNGDFFIFNDSSTNWTVKDNAFDGANIAQSVGLSNANNAYLNSSSRLLPTNASGDVILSSFSYSSGALGRYYHSSANLIDAGSRSPAAAGLYQFTVLSSQAKDTNAVVDIGFHYVAVNTTSGEPLDYDGDGFPDYLEDFNGNGSANTGETHWQNGNDPGLQVRITKPCSTGIVP